MRQLSFRSPIVELMRLFTCATQWARRYLNGYEMRNDCLRSGGRPTMPSDTAKRKRKKYPKCSHYRNGKHRFGIDNLSFTDVCMFRHGDVDNMCKCGFDRKKGTMR